MPHGQPVQTQIHERSRWLGRLWVIGDVGYYLGLVGSAAAIATIIAVPSVGGLASLQGDEDTFEWHWQLFPIGLLALPISIVVAVVSGCLKSYALRLSGIRDQDEAPIDR